MGLKDRVSQWWQNLHIGRGSGQAWLRGGLEEVRNALFPESNIARTTPGGVYGTATGIEITEQRDAPTAEQLQAKARETYGYVEHKPKERVIGD